MSGHIKHQSWLEPGASIGVAGLQRTGSFGCYLEDLETEEVLGLICGHNITIPPPGAPEVDLVELLPSGTNIIRHSKSDREERMLDLKSEIETHELINTTTQAPRNRLHTTHSGAPTERLRIRASKPRAAGGPALSHMLNFCRPMGGLGITRFSIDSRHGAGSSRIRKPRHPKRFLG